MNHVYRLVWNRAMRMWQPVSELAAQPRGGAAPAAVYAPVRWRLHAVAAALGLGLAGWGPASLAACSTAGLTVTCTTSANPLMPYYSNAVNNLSVSLSESGSVGVLLGTGGTAMLLQGSNLSVTNLGKIDAHVLGDGLSALSSGLVLGLPEASTPGFSIYNVRNEASGLIRGSGTDSYSAQMADLTGMALAVHNGEGGQTIVTNNGTISAKVLANGTRAGADIAAVAIYGGGVANFTNGATGTVTGRVAFEAATGSSNRFTNAGIINGSVSMGANSNNLFVAESGSSIGAPGLSGATIPITVAAVPGLTFAAPGTVDGGAGGSNSLRFADTANRGLTTSVTAGTYVNFNSLTVTGGTWSLSGGALLPAGSTIALNGGTVLVDNSGGLGTGQISAAGGGVGASSAGVSVGNTFVLGAGGLTAGGNQDFTLSGLLTGSGRLTVASTGVVTLTGSNDYAGGTTVMSGATLKGDANSLRGSFVNNGTVVFSSAANGTYAGMMSGTGDLSKQGSGTLSIAATLNHQGNTAIEAGVLRVAPGGSLAGSSRVTLNAGAVLDISSGSGQTVNGLAGSGGVVSLGANTLTLQNTSAAVFSGMIDGTGGLIKTGLLKQTLTGINTFTGGVEIQSGILALSGMGSLAAVSPVTVGAQGLLDLSAASNVSFGKLDGAVGSVVTLGADTLTLGAGAYDGMITGIGGLTKNTAATLTLNGVNIYSGPTQVNGGTLWVGGASANAGAILQSAVTVASGASIGGFGQVLGNVTVQSGGRLTPGAPGGTFTINGNLTLASGSQMDYSFGAPGTSGAAGAGHSVQVNGDLTLNGAQLNANDAGGFGVGVYRLFDYAGALTIANNGITGLPAGQTVQYLGSAKQVNLINSGNLMLNIWNADRQATPSQFGGGSGTWSRTSANWTDATAALTSAFSPSNGFAIFGGAPGTVTVDAAQGDVDASGAQFIADGYRLNGDALNLVAPSAGALSEVRVGDGSAPSAGWTTTLDNTIAGNGLNKTGAGTLVLNGANSYAQTRLSAGTLSVSSDANLGTALGGLDFQGGTLRVTGTAFQNTARAISLGTAGGGLDIADVANTFTVSQSLSGNGGLTKLGAGTLVLTGANTYLGSTTVAAGKLQVGDGATSGSIAGNADVQAGGTLAFKRSDRVVYDGAISGSGNLRQEGTGTLVLTGNSTFTGITTIASGSLQVGDGANSGTLGGTVINNGSLTFNRATDSTFAGAFAGTGSVFKVGAGTLALTGDSSAFTGTTLMSTGGLQVDGKLGGTVITTAQDNTVSGTGTLNHLMLGGGATLAPGNAATPFGTLNVQGNLSMQPGSSLRVAATADGQHSAVHVGGIASLAGSVLHVGQNGSYAPSTTYTILTAGAGVQGRFGDVSSNLAFLTPSLAYGANQVDLSMQLKQVPDTGNGGTGGNNGNGNGGNGESGGGTRPIQFADVAVTSNQRSVADALQSLPANSPLRLRVLNLSTGEPLDVFNALSGEAHATNVSVAQGVANTFVQVPMNRLRANLAAGMLPGVPTAQLGLGNAAALPQSSAQPLWAQVFGNWSSLSGNGNAARTTQSDSGVSVGGDVAVGGGWRLGGALGFANSRSRTGDRASSSQADSYSVTVYGGKAFDAGSAKLNLSLGASYTWHDMKTQRYANAAGLPQTLKADYDGNTSQVFGELGYAMPLTDRVTLEPFVGAGFSSLRTQGFTESGGDAALRGDAGRNNVTTTTLGLHARSAFDSAGAQGQLFGTLGWRHAFGDVDPASTMSFVQGGQSFTTNGVPIARDAALVELGVNMAVSKRTTVGVSYGGQFGEGNQQHSGMLDVRYRF